MVGLPGETGEDGIVGAVVILKQGLGQVKKFFWNRPLENCLPRSASLRTLRLGSSCISRIPRSTAASIINRVIFPVSVVSLPNRFSAE